MAQVALQDHTDHGAPSSRPEAHHLRQEQFQENRQGEEEYRRDEESRSLPQNELSLQAMRGLVRLNEQRIVLDSARVELKVVSRVKATLMWVVMLLFMWNWVELEKFDVRFKELGGGHGHLKCDHRLYGSEYVLNTWYSILICVTPIGRLLHADCILRKCCHYDPDASDFPFLHTSEQGSMNLFPETVRPGRPLRVQLLTASFLIFHISWSMLGIYYCCQDDVCRNINPRLALSVGIMCAVMLVYVTLSQISQIQIAYFMRLITREDAERAQAAAAARMAGCVAIEVDNFGQLNGEVPSDCPICMDPLVPDAALPSEGNRLVPGVCKTPCGHIFHESCLRDWASRSGTCPLCRQDLSNLSASEAGRLNVSAGGELQQLLLHLEAHSPERAQATRSILGFRSGP